MGAMGWSEEFYDQLDDPSLGPPGPRTPSGDLALDPARLKKPEEDKSAVPKEPEKEPPTRFERVLKNTVD
jgi:hypothetical protein